jgi:hypothetical protein
MGLMSSDTLLQVWTYIPSTITNPFPKLFLSLHVGKTKSLDLSQLRLGDCCAAFEYYQSLSLAVWTTWNIKYIV